MILVFEFVFPQYGLAAEAESSLLLPDLVIKAAADENQEVYLIAPIKAYKTVATYKIPITAYSSTVDQTDDTPCITANGFDLCAHGQEDVVAANFLPFGTKIRIPEYFGDRVFTVQDRMNARYYYHADIWMKTRQAAKEFGLVYSTVEVVE